MSNIDFGRFTWIDMEKPTRDELEKLAQVYPFHQLNIEDCFSNVQVSKIDSYPDHSFIILRFPFAGPNGNDSSKQVKVDQLCVFIGQDFLVTVHNSPLELLGTLRQSYSKGDESTLHEMGRRSPGFLLHRIIDGMVDKLLSNMQYFERELAGVEDAVVDGRADPRKNITSLRVTIATMTRLVIPLRRVIVDVTSDAKRFSDGEILAPYYSDVRDHIDKVLEELDASKAAVEIYNDTVYVAGTEKSNKILGILTILFTLTIPVTVLSSFYGMNIEIPGSVQSGPWTFWGPYTTVIIVIIESIVPAVIMILYFYHKKWTKV
ncbi:MAG: magnesium transporter CorA family protein [Nitrososphaera sp.]|jgi:magnesium transporter